MLVTLGVALNIMAIQLYSYDRYDNDYEHYDDYYDDRYDDDDYERFDEVLHKGNICMIIMSLLMIVITVSEIHLGPIFIMQYKVQAVYTA